MNPLQPPRCRTLARPRRGSGASVAVPARLRRPRSCGLPRRHDHAGRGARVGCRHAHGLDIVWSARHGATSTLPELEPAVLRPAAERPADQNHWNHDLGRTPNLANVAAAKAPFEVPLDRDGVVRLMLLWAVLCLGAATLLASGTAVATIHAGVIAALAGLAVVVVLTGLLALRGTPASALVGRLDRVRPKGRGSRPSHELLLAPAPRNA